MGHNEFWIGPGDEGYVDGDELDADHAPVVDDWGNSFPNCGRCGGPLTMDGQHHLMGAEYDAQGGLWVPDSAGEDYRDYQTRPMASRKQASSKVQVSGSSVSVNVGPGYENDQEVLFAAMVEVFWAYVDALDLEHGLGDNVGAAMQGLQENVEMFR